MSPYKQYTLLLLVLIAVAMLFAAYYAYHTYRQFRHTSTKIENTLNLVTSTVGSMKGSPLLKNLFASS